MNLDGYIPVHERLRRALERFPDLHVVEDGWRLVELGDRSALECVVRVYRTVDDPLPVVGTVLEPFPGSTPFTRGSELMVGFTSALGRALGYLGVGLEAGLASRDEIAARTGPDRDDRRSQEPADRPPTIPGEDRRRRPPTEKMLSLLRTLLEERDVILDPAEETATLADFDACRRKLDELQAMPKVRR